MLIYSCPDCGYARLPYDQLLREWVCPRCKAKFGTWTPSKAHQHANNGLLALGELSTFNRQEKAPWET